MLDPTILYNVLLLATALLTLQVVRRKRTALSGALALSVTGLAGLVLAILLERSRFAEMRLFAYGVFLYVPLVLGATAWLLTRTSARVLAALGALAVAGIGLFSFAIEPFRLEVTRVELESPKLERGLRVLLLSDLQTDRVGRYERKVLAEAMKLSPDLILMSGDYLQVPSPAERAVVREELREALREVRLQAPLGIFAVAGNIDRPDWPRIFQGFPVQVVGSTTSFELSGVTVTGLGVRDSFDTELVIPEVSRYHIVVGHSPDYALGDISADLLLAGHTHGGQVQLPWIGPIMTLSRIPRSWASGVTRLDEKRTLVVSRGIGMERGPAPRLRFLCRPELVVIDLVPAGGAMKATGS